MNVGAAVQQQPRRVGVAVPAREQERGYTFLVRLVDLGAVVQEPRYRFDFASLRRIGKSRFADSVYSMARFASVSFVEG